MYLETSPLRYILEKSLWKIWKMNHRKTNTFLVSVRSSILFCTSSLKLQNPLKKEEKNHFFRPRVLHVNACVRPPETPSYNLHTRTWTVRVVSDIITFQKRAKEAWDNDDNIAPLLVRNRRVAYTHRYAIICVPFI